MTKRSLIAVLALAWAATATAAEPSKPDPATGQTVPPKKAAAKPAAASKPATPKRGKASAPKDTALKQIDRMIAQTKVDKSKPAWRTTLTQPRVASFDSARSYFANMVTNKGAIRIRFFPDVAPMHVTSFIYLTRLGFYDGLSFHRVIPGFMAQGGCPLGNGSGNPGYQFPGEFRPDVKHSKPGVLSTANAGPGTDGSQFFLTFVPTPSLDGGYTIFGEVVDGLEVLKKLEAAGSPSGQTSEPLLMEKVTIEVR